MFNTSITLLIWSLKCVIQHFQRTQKMKRTHFHNLYDIPSGIVKQIATSVLQSRGRKSSIVLINAKQLLLARSSWRKSNTFSSTKDQRETVIHLLQEHHINDWAYLYTFWGLFSFLSELTEPSFHFATTITLSQCACWVVYSSLTPCNPVDSRLPGNIL